MKKIWLLSILFFITASVAYWNFAQARLYNPTDTNSLSSVSSTNATFSNASTTYLHVSRLFTVGNNISNTTTIYADGLTTSTIMAPLVFKNNTATLFSFSSSSITLLRSNDQEYIGTQTALLEVGNTTTNPGGINIYSTASNPGAALVLYRNPTAIGTYFGSSSLYLSGDGISTSTFYNTLIVHNQQRPTFNYGRFRVDSNGNTSVSGTFQAFATTTLADGLVSTKTSNIGWSVVAVANQACNTTCTNACVVGFADDVTGQDAVACSDAAADSCLCAGAN